MSPAARLLCLIPLLCLTPTVRAAAPPAAAEVLEQFATGRDGDPLVVPVTIQGRQYPFLLDTGAVYTVYDVFFLPMLGRTREMEVFGPHGLTKMLHGQQPEARVGRLAVPRDGIAQVYDFRELREQSGLVVYGALGMDFLSRHVVRVDPDAGRVAFLRSAGHQGGERVRLFNNGTGLAAIEVDVGDGGPPALFAIDTGQCGNDSCSLGETLFWLLEQQGKLRRSRDSREHTVHGTRVEKRYRLERLAVGPFEHRDLSVGVSQLTRLGMPFLARYVATFDFPRATLYLNKGRNHHLPDPCDASGLTIEQHRGRLVITHVERNSPASRARLRRRDVVVAVDDRPVGEMSTLAVWRVLCGRGRGVRLTISREGLERTVRMVLPAESETARKRP
jgi:hypothetical protein